MTPETERNEALREEFNRWAEAGRGEGMEEEHLPIVLPVLDAIGLAPDDNVLDVGCGAGWLARLLAERLPEGRVIGMDISDEMVRRARRNYVSVENAMFVIGGVDEIPWDANFFSHAISVESAYYWPDPAQGLARDLSRAARGRVGVDSDQLLSRKSALPPVGRAVRDARALAGRRGVGRHVPRRGIFGYRAPPNSRSHARAGNLYGPLVSRCRANAGVPERGRAADPRREIVDCSLESR